MAKGILVSLIIVAVGVAWLLSTAGIIRGEDWIWTTFLGIAGVVTLAWGKINKLSFVVGLFLLISSIFSILRITVPSFGKIEVPLLVVVFGLLFLLAQLPMIPHTQMVIQMKKDADQPKL